MPSDCEFPTSVHVAAADDPARTRCTSGSSRFVAAVAVFLATGLPSMSAKPADSAPSNASNIASKDKTLSADTFAGLALRGLGPGLMSGRIADFAVHPTDRGHYYAAVCSGGVWKTVNNGTTWTPVFDGEGSYSIGCVTLDPNNPHVVWVGSGENNSQRSVSFGDGVYRSRNGGKSWENVGLRESEHIGMIAIDPRDSDVIYVAAQGPLWRSGGDRGLYKSTDGGSSWSRILFISDDTGVNEVHLDPRDPDVIYASSYQRRRHVWTLINGGPESAIYKSTDAGATWRKMTSGLPGVDMGRIGLDIAPANPDVVYAIIEAAMGESGFYRSTDRGETWEKRSSYVAGSPQYYNEIVCDPNHVDRVYSLDTFMHVTEDGGKTFNRAPRQYRHVDDHALWINPADSDHLLVGCDGGVYESYDRGENWAFKDNLPVTQFYRVNVDNAEPFYNIYGGTQDNNSFGGPTRTTDRVGIVNADWFVTVGGDGYETVVDPTDPNIVYSEWQYGGLIRHDRRSGEIIDIKPREKPGEDPNRWNWDSPLIISPHSHTRLYFASQRLYRTDDRGASWTAISGDLSRNVDRNQLEVMGKIQNIDAVAKNNSTSFYGNIVSLDESPQVEGLIYVGTDDGLVQVTEDGGANWRKISAFPSVPDNAYVSCLTASLHQPDTVFAAFDNHKQGDFRPYLLRSDDRGQNWTPITGDLPNRDTVWTLRQDHEKPDLLFAGTEFGLYFTVDGGKQWVRLSGGLPTIAVRDIEIQRRENDLALGTFGRGFYVLDDYTPLREIGDDVLAEDAVVFPIKDALRYVERSRLGGRTGRGSQGASYYAAPNPPFGATFTYYLREKIMTRKEQRKEAEKKAAEAKTPYVYPTWDELRAEDEEIEPKVMFVVRDDSGEVVEYVDASREKGIHRVTWALRYPSVLPVSVSASAELAPWENEPVGPLALPGTYTATLAKLADGAITELAEPASFDVVPLEMATFPAEDREAALAFQRKVASLHRAVRGSLRAAGEAQDRIKHLRKAVTETPGVDPSILADIEAAQSTLNVLQTELRGDRTVARRSEPTSPSINERVANIVESQWYSTASHTKTQEEEYRIAGQQFGDVLEKLGKLMDDDLQSIEDRLEDAGAPWTPGRLPKWNMQ